MKTTTKLLTGVGIATAIGGTALIGIVVSLSQGWITVPQFGDDTSTTETVDTLPETSTVEETTTEDPNNLDAAGEGVVTVDTIVDTLNNFEQPAAHYTIATETVSGEVISVGNTISVMLNSPSTTITGFEEDAIAVDDIVGKWIAIPTDYKGDLVALLAMMTLPAEDQVFTPVTIPVPFEFTTGTVRNKTASTLATLLLDADAITPLQPTTEQTETTITTVLEIKPETLTTVLNTSTPAGYDELVEELSGNALQFEIITTSDEVASSTVTVTVGDSSLIIEDASSPATIASPSDTITVQEASLLLNELTVTQRQFFQQVNNVKYLRRALHQYYENTGSYPEELQQLIGTEILPNNTSALDYLYTGRVVAAIPPDIFLGFPIQYATGNNSYTMDYQITLPSDFGDGIIASYVNGTNTATPAKASEQVEEVTFSTYDSNDYLNPSLFNGFEAGVVTYLDTSDFAPSEASQESGGITSIQNPFEYYPTSDRDGDGLTNAEEDALGTAIDNIDTDGDGYTDKQEVDAGFDPLTVP